MGDIVAQHTTSSCSSTKEEHAVLVNMLLALCSDSYENTGNRKHCVHINMSRMRDLCKIIRLQDLVEFYPAVKDFAKTYQTDVKTAFIQLAKSWGIPAKHVRDKYNQSSRANACINMIMNEADLTKQLAFGVHFDNPSYLLLLVRDNQEGQLDPVLHVVAYNNEQELSQTSHLWSQADVFLEKVLLPIFNSEYKVGKHKNWKYKTIKRVSNFSWAA